MRYIVLTQPDFWQGEAERIVSMFQSGLACLHLRKPGGTADEVRALLQAIPPVYHNRIVLHEHFELLQEYALAGVHLNRRNPEPPQGWTGHVSISCHSLDELLIRKQQGFTYLSLSPIFNSISKQGYESAFTAEQLRQAHQAGIIDERVMALGGICRENVFQAQDCGFGGVMVLGDAWRQPELPVVLTIAGSDSSAGAGVQQDLKTLTHCGCYGATVITALTAQNTQGVQRVEPVSPDMAEAQLRAVFEDMDVRAVKIGMLPNIGVAERVVKVLREEKRKRILPVVCDPVMISTSGTRLMAEDCIRLVIDELFPLCTLITPNLPEQQYLDQQGCPSFTRLVKGGHAEGEQMTDRLYLKDEDRWVEYSSPRIASHNLHGTGCTLSSAVAAGLAKGYALEQAVGRAKAYVTQAIQGGATLRLGKGNGPLWMHAAFGELSSGI